MREHSVTSTHFVQDGISAFQTKLPQAIQAGLNRVIVTPPAFVAMLSKTSPHNDLNPHVDHYIGIDVGTGSARACVIDSHGDIKARMFPESYPAISSKS